MSHSPRTISKDMGFSVAEFERGLARVLGAEALTIEAPDRAVIRSSENGQLIVSYREQPPRKIALLSIPVLAVTITFADFANPEAEDEMLARFDQALQRGGG